MDMNLTYDVVGNMYADLGYRFYDEGKFNVNIFGIRKDLTVDIFNDVLGIAYRDQKNNPRVVAYNGTTDPGLYWLKNKLGNIKGTFILKPGYYPKCWKVDKHKGQYEALVQAGPRIFKGWRDSNSDGKLDISGQIFDDVTGLNLHTTSHFRGTAEKVGPYSAACQVIQRLIDYLELMGIVKASRDTYGNLFSYALFDHSQN